MCIPANQLSGDEEKLIRQYIFLPLIRLALDRDRRVMAIANLKFKSVYYAEIDAARHRVTNDIRKLKDEMFDRHIVMQKKDWLCYTAIVRNIPHEISYHRTIAAEWINSRIEEYFIQEH
jgi:hypothetical protein